jgi:hypothetical protein
LAAVAVEFMEAFLALLVTASLAAQVVVVVLQRQAILQMAALELQIKVLPVVTVRRLHLFMVEAAAGQVQ